MACCLLFSHSLVSNSLWLHGLWYARLLCPSLSARVCSNSCPLSQWCYLIISFTTVPFSFQFSSVQLLSRVWLCQPMKRSTLGLPVHHQLPESSQTHVHWVGDAIQPSHPLLSLSPPAHNLSQHQGLFQWVSSSHQVAKVLEFQLQHQSFQWTPRTDLL